MLVIHYSTRNLDRKEFSKKSNRYHLNLMMLILYTIVYFNTTKTELILEKKCVIDYRV